MKTILVIVFGAFFAGASGAAWNAARVARETDVALAVFVQKEVRVNAEIQQAEKRIAVAEREDAAMRATLVGLQKAKAASRPGPSAGPAASAQELEKKLTEARQHLEDPKAQLPQLAERRAGINAKFGVFLQKLGLAPAQIERFVDIRTKRYEHDMDLGALVKQGVVSSDDSVVVKLREQAAAEEAAAYRELLGESGFDRLHEYDRTAVARDLVTGFAAVAVIAGSPLARAELEQLVQAVANGCSNYRSGGAVSWKNDTIDWEIVDAQARPFLTDAQWALFKNNSYLPGFSISQSRFKAAIAKAAQADTAARVAQAAKPPGG